MNKFITSFRFLYRTGKNYGFWKKLTTGRLFVIGQPLPALLIFVFSIRILR
jgi:hypothetical protein